MALIRLDHVSHSFTLRTGDAMPVLQDISLTVERGEFVTIVGPSGCGKSTVLNILVGMVRPNEGVVEIDGRPVGPASTDRVGYMFARDGLLPWRTALGNVELAMELKGVSGRPRRDRARELLATVGLGGFMDHYRHQLSQGMRQRVALARTLAADPEILLMDEPFAALDAQTRAILGEEFARVCEAAGKTVIFVTHDLLEAIGLGDRVLVFSARPGRILRTYTSELPRPRCITDLQLDAVAGIYHSIWNDLRSELQSL